MWTKLSIKTCLAILILIFFWEKSFSQLAREDSLLQNLGNCLIQSLPEGVMAFSRPDTNDVFFVKTIVLEYSHSPIGKGRWTEIPVGYPMPVLFKAGNQGKERQLICSSQIDKLKHVWGEEDWSVLFVFDHFMLGPKTHFSEDEIADKVSLASDSQVGEIIKQVQDTSDLKYAIRLLFKVGPTVY